MLLKIFFLLSTSNYSNQLNQAKLLADFKYLKVVHSIRKGKVAGDKGISETKSKQQSPRSNCMH
jgi:hypothetical protein